jgi:hypothetical protein
VALEVQQLLALSKRRHLSCIKSVNQVSFEQKELLKTRATETINSHYRA